MCVIQTKQGDKCEMRTKIICFGHVELLSSVMLYLSYKCDFNFLFIYFFSEEERGQKRKRDLDEEGEEDDDD